MSPLDDPLVYRLFHGWRPSRQEMAQMSVAELLELFKCSVIRLWAEAQILAQMVERDDALRERVHALVRHCQAEIKKRNRNQ